MDITPNGHSCVPSTLEEARKILSDSVNAVIARTNNRLSIQLPDDNNQHLPPRILLVKTPPASGKTYAVCNAIPNLRKGKVAWIVAPNHDVALEIYNQLKHLPFSQFDIRHIKGAEQPDMCQRKEAMLPLLGNSYSFEITLCSQIIKGVTIKCPLYENCAFQNQFKNFDPNKTTVLILQKSHLWHLRKEVPNPDILFIEENVIEAVKDLAIVSLPELAKAAGLTFNESYKRLIEGLSTYSQGCLVTHLKAKRLGYSDISSLHRQLVHIIRSYESSEDISPLKADRDIANAIKQNSLSALKSGRTIFDKLMAAFISDKPCPNKFKLKDDNLSYYGLHDVNALNTPEIVILDSTSDEHLISIIFGAISEVLELPIESSYSVTQVYNAPLSTSSLKMDSKATKLLKERLQLIDKKTLIGTPKSVLENFKLDNINLTFVSFKGTRGTNKYSHFQHSIAIGREQFSHELIEGLARCIQTDSLSEVKAFEGAKMPKRKVVIQHSDNEEVTIEETYYPDPYMEQVNRQYRLVDILQFMHRTRGTIYPSREFTFIGNLKLGIKIDKAISWEEWTYILSPEYRALIQLMNLYKVIPLNGLVWGTLTSEWSAPNIAKCYLRRRFEGQAEWAYWVACLIKEHKKTDLIFYIRYWVGKAKKPALAITWATSRNEIQAELERLFPDQQVRFEMTIAPMGMAITIDFDDLFIKINS